jgi:DNA processing protein
MSTAHWLALTTTTGIGSVTTRKLLDHFEDVESIFAASPEEIANIPRITLEIAQQLLAISFDQLETELISLSDEGIDVLTWDDDHFPKWLRSLNDAPVVLFVRGALLPADERAVAIVGTRQPNHYATELANTLARELSERGLTVVSGLAAGIDTVAHRGALAYRKGRTLAVLGSGIRVIHPRSNIELAEQIVVRGALISELHPDSPPRGPQLMARDRIISGLSKAIIVVEAGERSGSLDTAARAKKQSRPVFAVPGSKGTDILLNEGCQRIDPDNVEFDILAEEITAFTPPNSLHTPRQGRLF